MTDPTVYLSLGPCNGEAPQGIKDFLIYLLEAVLKDNPPAKGSPKPMSDPQIQKPSPFAPTRMVLQAIAAVPQPFEKSAEVSHGTVQLQPLSDPVYRCQSQEHSLINILQANFPLRDYFLGNPS